MRLGEPRCAHLTHTRGAKPTRDRGASALGAETGVVRSLGETKRGAASSPSGPTPPPPEGVRPHGWPRLPKPLVTILSVPCHRQCGIHYHGSSPRLQLKWIHVLSVSVVMLTWSFLTTIEKTCSTQYHWKKLTVHKWIWIEVYTTTINGPEINANERVDVLDRKPWNNNVVLAWSFSDERECTEYMTKSYVLP